MDSRSRGKRSFGNAKAVRAKILALVFICGPIIACVSTGPDRQNSPTPQATGRQAAPSDETAGDGTPTPKAEPVSITDEKVATASGQPTEMTERAVTKAQPISTISPPPGLRSGNRRPPKGRVQSLSTDQVRVLESAFELLDLPPDCPITINGKHFKLDCIGTVSAIFYKLGIDITKDFNRYTGNGVGRLFKSLKDKGTLHMDRFPETGDIVFWNNTWDANGDGNFNNDPTTHAAVVLQVEDDGTIHYVHEHVRKGVIVERMNLYRPDVYRTDFGKILNNAMALGSYFGNPGNPPHWLSGDLWYQFGGILGVKDQF